MVGHLITSAAFYTALAPNRFKAAKSANMPIGGHFSGYGVPERCCHGCRRKGLRVGRNRKASVPPDETRSAAHDRLQMRLVNDRNLVRLLKNLDLISRVPVRTNTGWQGSETRSLLREFAKFFTISAGCDFKR
jgi:hypothetical protein